ncbi:MAG: HAD-IA family hydrolase [Phycisphaerae bacterium]
MTRAHGRPRLVAFDWGGVILRHCRSWGEGCRAAGLAVHDEVLTPEHIARRRALTQAFQRGELEESAFLQGLHEANDGRYTVDELTRIHDAWLLDEYEGVRPVIERLNATPGVETALLSNTNAAHWRRHLPRPGGGDPDYPTAGLLRHRHASHLLGLAKPDEAIYVAFERATGFSGPEILYFDDLAENLEAPSRLGWRCVHVDHAGDTAVQIVASLRSSGVFA